MNEVLKRLNSLTRFRRFFFRRPRIRARLAPSALLLVFSLSFTLNARDFFSQRNLILENHWKRLGPVYLTPRLLLRNLGYSDNIYRYSEYSVGDWTLDLGLELESDLLLGRRLILSYRILPQYHLYAQNSALSNWTLGHSLSLLSYLGPFDIRVNGHADQNFGVPNPEYGLSIRYKSSGGDAQISLGNPRHVNLQFTLAQTENEFEDLRYLSQFDLSQFDYRLQSGAVALSFGIFTRTRLALEFQRQRLIYSRLPELDAEIDQLGLSLILPELSSLRGTLSLGMQRYRPQSGLYSPLDTPYGSGSVVLQPGRRWRLLLGYQIRVQNSFNQIDQMFLQNSWNLGFDLYLSRRWRLGYRLSDNNLQYRRRSEAQMVLRSDRFQLHGLQLAWRITEKLALGLAWNKAHTVQSSQEWRRDYSFIGGYLETDF